MRQSKFYIPTMKEVPSDAEIISHQLMLKAGMIKQTAAGVYTYLPLGYRVLRKIEQVVREEMENAGASEILMPVLHPSELWKVTNRWNEYGDELMRMTDRHGREFALGPTHEEVITDLIKDELNSAKKLPVTLFQIQTKFRDEMRPRFGLMRGREFMMKDAYSFNESVESMDQSYEEMKEAYFKIFNRLDLNFRMVEADSGQIGGSESAEFMVISEVGEDVIAYSDSGDFAANIEVCDLQVGDKAPDGGIIKHDKTIEIGHIFKLGTKYSKDFKARFQVDGGMQDIHMGCYGIGVSRLIMAIIEQNNDERGIVWPKEVTPFDVHVIYVDGKDEEQVKHANQVYDNLRAKGYEVLLDDRDQRAGVKFADSDLIGVPVRIVIGKGIKEGKVEVKVRTTGETFEMDIDQVCNCEQINNLK